MGLVHNPNVVSDGLVGCWDAGNRRSYPGAGTTWTDLVLQNAGSMSPSPTFESDKAGVMSFDGTDDVVTISSSTELSALTTGDFSFEAWVNVVDADSNPNKYVGVIVLVDVGLVLMGHTYPAGEAGVGILWPVTGNNYAGEFTSATIKYNEWAYIGCTRTGTTYNTYINGVNYTTSTDDGNWAMTDWKIGKGYSSHFFYGDMGVIRVYNRVLTDAEIKQNYEAMKPRFKPRITKSGLLGYWDAGDPASYPGGTTLKNTVSGTAATFVNMDGSNFNSANGGYWDFDGTNEAISTNSKFNARTLGFTGTAWVKMTGDKVANVFFWQNYVAQFRYDNSDKLNFSEGLGNNWGGAVDITSAADLIANDTWVHVAAVYDSSDDGRKLYLNGAVVASNTSVITGSQAAPIRTMYFGSEETVSAYLLDGSIAQVILYEGALSDAQIMDNFQKTRGRFGV